MILLPPQPDAAEPGVPAVCSARGCRRPAGWALRWNNPKLHDPERRKIWTACDEHRETLGQFLQLRGFLRDVVPLDDLPEANSQETQRLSARTEQSGQEEG